MPCSKSHTTVFPTPGRARLEASARDLLGREVGILDHGAGVRVTLRDKLPAAGRIGSGLGVANALGGKGALFGPMLAAQWVRMIRFETPIDRERDVVRFGVSSLDVQTSISR